MAETVPLGTALGVEGDLWMISIVSDFPFFCLLSHDRRCARGQREEEWDLTTSSLTTKGSLPIIFWLKPVLPNNGGSKMSKGRL